MNKWYVGQKVARYRAGGRRSNKIDQMKDVIEFMGKYSDGKSS